MIIAMVTHMSGGRYDDRQWPGPGVPFEVPDWEGEGLVKWHHAIQLADSPEPPVDTFVDEPSPEPSRESPQWSGDPPKPASPKQDWIEWAISEGADPEQAANMTKVDLMSRYGSRI